PCLGADELARAGDRDGVEVGRRAGGDGVQQGIVRRRLDVAERVVLQALRVVPAPIGELVLLAVVLGKQHRPVPAAGELRRIDPVVEAGAAAPPVVVAHAAWRLAGDHLRSGLWQREAAGGCEERRRTGTAHQLASIDREGHLRYLLCGGMLDQLLFIDQARLVLTHTTLRPRRAQQQTPSATSSATARSSTPSQRASTSRECSPSSGAGRGVASDVRLRRTAFPLWRCSPISGWCSVTSARRAARCSSSRSSLPFTTAIADTPAAWRVLAASSALRVRVHVATASSTVARAASRPASVAHAGSTGRPRTRAQRSQASSPATAIATQRSSPAEGKTPCGHAHSTAFPRCWARRPVQASSRYTSPM